MHQVEGQGFEFVCITQGNARVPEGEEVSAQLHEAIAGISSGQMGFQRVASRTGGQVSLLVGHCNDTSCSPKRRAGEVSLLAGFGSSFPKRRNVIVSLFVWGFNNDTLYWESPILGCQLFLSEKKKCHCVIVVF